MDFDALLQALLGAQGGQAEPDQDDPEAAQMRADMADARTADIQGLGEVAPAGYEGEVLPNMQAGMDEESKITMSPTGLLQLMMARVR